MKTHYFNLSFRTKFKFPFTTGMLRTAAASMVAKLMVREPKSGGKHNKTDSFDRTDGWSMGLWVPAAKL